MADKYLLQELHLNKNKNNIKVPHQDRGSSCQDVTFYLKKKNNLKTYILTYLNKEVIFITTMKII